MRGHCSSALELLRRTLGFVRKLHLPYIFHFISMCLNDRVAIRPVFPGHVLFFRVKNSVWPDFLNLAKCLGFLINDCL